MPHIEDKNQGLLAKAFLCIRNLEKYDDSKDNIESRLFYTAENRLKGIDKKSMSDAKNTGYHVFPVQYNPASLHFSASNDARSVHRKNDADKMVQAQDFYLPKIVSMDVTLVFEDVNNDDSFTFPEPEMYGFKDRKPDSVRFEKKKDQKKSVLTIMDGIMGLLMNKLTREVVFVYGRTIFKGVVESVNEEFKMFNSFGEPVMAQMQLSIKQHADVNAWNNPFKALDNLNFDENTSADGKGRDEPDPKRTRMG